MRLGVVGVAGDGLAQCPERRVVEPAIVEHLAAVEAGHGAGGIGRTGALEPRARGIEVAPGLLGQAELEHRRHVARVPREERLELGHRLHVTAEGRIGAGQLPPGLALLRPPPHPLAQLGDAAVVVPALPVGDVQIVLGHLHPGIELERLHELGDRLLHQSLLVVEHAEIVVRSGIGWVDPAGERAEDGEIALGKHGGRHRVRAGGWRRRSPAATACRAGAESVRARVRCCPPPGRTCRRRRRNRGRGRS